MVGVVLVLGYQLLRKRSTGSFLDILTGGSGGSATVTVLQHGCPQCFEENNVFRIVIIVGWASQILKPAIIIDLFQ